MSKHHKLSLDVDVGSETHENTVPDDHLAATEALADQHELETAVDAALDVLTDREQQVLRFWFGLHGTPELPPETIAERLGMSRTAVKRVKTKALRKLRDRGGAEPLKPFAGEE